LGTTLFTVTIVSGSPAALKLARLQEARKSFAGSRRALLHCHAELDAAHQQTGDKQSSQKMVLSVSKTTSARLGLLV
jgi:hypothetical protein